MLVTVLDAHRKTGTSRRHVKQVAGKVERVVFQCLLTKVSLRVGHVVEHLLGDRAIAVRALATEEVKRYAVRCGRTNGRVAHRDLQIGRIVRIELLLESAIVAIARRQVPIEIFSTGSFDSTLQADGGEVRIDVLEEQAATRFKRPATEEFEVTVSDRQINSERVVRVRCGDEEIIVNPVAAAVAETKRLGRSFGCRRTVRVRRLCDQINVGRNCVCCTCENIDPLVGRTQVVKARTVIVESVGTCKRMEIIAVAWVRRIKIRDVTHAVVQYAVIQCNAGKAEVWSEDKSTLRSERGTE